MRLLSRAQDHRQARQHRVGTTTGSNSQESNSNNADPPPVPVAVGPPVVAATRPSSQSSFRASSTLPSTNPAPNQQNTTRNALGGFLNRDGNAIRSNEHAIALIGMIQLGAGHADGLAGSLGHNNRTAWMGENIDALFRVDGPLGSFHPLSLSVLMRHFSRAQNFARTFFDRDHSNEQSGAGQEEIPEWVRQFFRVFEAQQNQPTRNMQDAAVRDERRSVVASLAGRQAPLGFRGSSNGRPASLRTETSRNNDVPSSTRLLRRQVVGNVDAETIYDNGGEDDADVFDDYEEGRDDVGRRRAAPRRRISNGVRRRNVHTAGFGPDDNDPSSRFYNVQRGYASLDSLSQAVSLSITAAPPRPPRTMMDIVREYHETNRFMADATTGTEIAFYSTALQLLQSEIDTMAAGVTTEENANGYGSNNIN
jgi:hypothetical protein